MKLTNDAYIVVYSVTDKASFLTAIDLLKTIRSNEIHDNYPIILVGNKSDLVRKRSITREGEYYFLYMSARYPGSLASFY